MAILVIGSDHVPVGGELPIVPLRLNRRVMAVIQPSPNPYPCQGSSQGQGRAS